MIKKARSFSRRFSHLRLLVAGTFLSAAVAMLFASSAPEPASDTGDIIQTSFVPRSVSADAMVVVQLKGKSVAEAQADAGRKLTATEKNQIKNQLKGNQDSVKSQIQAAGGKILAQFQSALNGIKVQIPASKLNQLRSISGVIALLPVREDFPDNATSVPYIGAPTVWAAPTNIRGEGIKVGVIDSGIDYTHANFGGPGTAAAYTTAHATETAPADPALFGPAAAKVKGGFDLVGDAYTGSNPPAPDPNPLDCGGHGSHTSGTAAGFGVTSGGTTYTGPYNPSIYTPGAFRIGPGVAPKADLFAYRVFGCTGSTRVTVDAINMAFDDGMDVINMSLGSPFGTADDASAVASTNVAKAGIIVVASAGNNGANQYITGSPSTGTGAISVAANDANGSFPGVLVATSPPSGTPLSLTALNSNGYVFSGPIAGPLVVLKDDPTTTTDTPGFIGSADESLGCSPAAYTFNGVVPGGGQLVVAKRGTCGRVAKAIFGQQAGAAAVLMTNNAAGLPPFEGPITSNPDTGIPYTVTIPFVGIAGDQATSGTDSFKLQASPAGTTATLSPISITNTNFSGFASFTSRGPRNGDSWLKPDITAPGVSTLSTLVGSGNQGTVESGTSMSSPHVAGVAALVKQAHPTWKQVQELKAAIVNTGSPSAIGGITPYRTSRGGTGLVQPIPAVNTNVIALGDTATSTLNFGFSELKADFSQTKAIKLRNKGASPATFNISQTNASQPGVSPHSIVLGSSSVTVPAGTEVTVNVTLNVPVATAGDSNGGALSFREVAGLITFTPASASDNKNVALRVPYYLVPRVLSAVNATMAKSVTTGSPSTNANLSNSSGPIAGKADFYAWGLNGAKSAGQNSADVRAIGTQSFPFGADQLLVFAVNTWNRWSNAATNEFDIYVDVDGDGIDDYIIAGVDQGAVQTGTFNGRMAAFVFSTRSAGASVNFFATARTDSSTAELPILASQLCRSGEACLSSGNPRLTYHAFGFDLTSDFVKVVAGPAKYNAYSSSISQGGDPVSVPKGASGTVPVSIDPTEWAKTPALGEMIVTLDNAAGAGEAALLPLTLTP
jgi:minor extracellular serine protease Vpr